MKTRLSAEISTTLYMLPMLIVFYAFILTAVSTVEKSITPLLPIFLFIGIIMAIIWLILSQCKILYFDKEYLYINSLFKNKLIKKVELNKVVKVDRPFSFLRIEFIDKSQKHKVFTFPERKSIHTDLGIGNLPTTKFFWGKPENRIAMLKHNIQDKQENN